MRTLSSYFVFGVGGEGEGGGGGVVAWDTGSLMHAAVVVV